MACNCPEFPYFPDMREVPATEFAKRFSQYRQAAQREPVAVTHHNRVTEVLMSKADYDEYVRLKSLATRAIAVEDLSAAMLEALSASRMDDRHDHLNQLLDD
jgi:prevent-host-death family protein